MAKAPKTSTRAPGAGAKVPTPKAGHNSNPAEQQSLFVSDKDKYERALATKKKADADFKNTCKTIKADGFTVAQIKAAIDFDTPEGEARQRTAVLEILQAARWMNSPIGTQLEIFQEPDRTPSVDRAYDEGKLASASNKPASPPYDPSLPQHASYMNGYTDHQSQLMGGFRAPADQSKSESI